MIPSTEANRLIELSARHTALSEEIKSLVRIKAKIWPILREHAKSKADADREWEMSEHGIREREIKIEMESLASQMSAIKTWLRQQEVEAKNQY